MAKKIRFPLKMENGAEVRNLDDLKENFSVESVVGYFRDGRLLTWLKDRYYESEAEQVAELQDTQPDFVLRLCKIFGQDYEAGVDVEEIRRRQERLNRLKDFTNDPEILDHVDLVAFDQEELSDLLDEDQLKIYLCGDRFMIPSSRHGITYIGVNNPKVHISGKKVSTTENLDIHFENVDVDNFDPVSSQVQKGAAIREAPSDSSEITIPMNEIHEWIEDFWMNLVPDDPHELRYFTVGDYLLLPASTDNDWSWYDSDSMSGKPIHTEYSCINLRTGHKEVLSSKIQQELPSRIEKFRDGTDIQPIWIFENRLYYLQEDLHTIKCFDVVEKSIKEYVCQHEVDTFTANNEYICYYNEHYILCIKNLESQIEVSPTYEGNNIRASSAFLRFYEALSIDEQSVFCVAGPGPEITNSDDPLRRSVEMMHHLADIWEYSFKNSSVKIYHNDQPVEIFYQHGDGMFSLTIHGMYYLDKETEECQELFEYPRNLKLELCRSTDAFYCADNKLYMLDFRSREVKLLVSDCEYVCSCIGNWLVYAGDNDLRYLLDINHPSQRVIL